MTVWLRHFLVFLYSQFPIKSLELCFFQVCLMTWPNQNTRYFGYLIPYTFLVFVLDNRFLTLPFSERCMECQFVFLLFFLCQQCVLSDKWLSIDCNKPLIASITCCTLYGLPHGHNMYHSPQCHKILRQVECPMTSVSVRKHPDVDRPEVKRLRRMRACAARDNIHGRQ